MKVLVARQVRRWGDCALGRADQIGWVAGGL